MDGVYGHRPVADAKRVARAILANQLARLLPKAYMRLTGETGRGRSVVPPTETAAYFMTCVHEYLDALDVPRDQLEQFWRNRRIVEYGPGDIPGVALLLVGLGAQSVLCVDRFRLVRFSDYQQDVVRGLAALLPSDACRTRMYSCFVDARDLARGLASGPVTYWVTESGLVGRDGIADFVISRAVLEHVNDLPATFDDMVALLAPGGVSIHKVDLKSHGLHRRNRLDFLTWPDHLWRWMFSNKGAPNRLRVDQYVREAQRVGFEIASLRPCELASMAEVDEIRPFLAAPFRLLSNSDLSWLSFWMVCRRRGLQVPGQQNALENSSRP